MTLQTPPPTKHMVVSEMGALIASVDERARDCNRKWGFNRLPHLVPLDWLGKFRKQKQSWELACFECTGSPLPDDLDRVRKLAGAMLRAFDKLEQLAVENGYLPTPPEQWEFELTDGTPVILVRDRAEMGQVDPKGRTVQIWSLEEVAEIVGKFPALIRAKDAFPGAEIVQMKTDKRVIDELNDSLADLPF